MRAKFGEYLSRLPMPHDHHAKELPLFCMENNLSSMTRLCDDEDTTIETVRKDDCSKNIIRSSKTNDSSCGHINFTTLMGLSFEHTRPACARASEQSLVE